MTGTAGLDEDSRRRIAQIHREIRWLAGALEGIAAAGFTAFLARRQAGAPGTWFGLALDKETVLAFVAAAVAAYIVWPVTREGDGFSPFRIGIFTMLIVLLGCFLWLLLLAAANPMGAGMASMRGGEMIVAALVGFLFLGWRLIPLGLCAALIVAYWGGMRLRRIKG